MFFKNNKLLGLDIGSSSIKVAELDISMRSTQLVGFAMVPTPDQAMVGGEMHGAAEISAAVAQAVGELKTKRKNVALGLWGTSVIVKRISIPQVDEKLIAGQIRWEAEQYIPYEISDVHVDFKVLKSLSKSPETMDVLLVAAKKDSVFLYQDVAQGAGLNPAVVDLSGFALANCALKNEAGLENEIFGIVDMGASVSNFVVVERGEVIFCRDLPVGGGTYSAEIQKSMGISFGEAEALKLSASRDQANPEEVVRALNGTHEVVADEYQSCLDFFINTNPGISLNKLLFTGGGFRTPGLLPFLRDSVKVSWSQLNPMGAIGVKANAFTADFVNEIQQLGSVAIGLGQRKIGDS